MLHFSRLLFFCLLGLGAVVELNIAVFKALFIKSAFKLTGDDVILNGSGDIIGLIVGLKRNDLIGEIDDDDEWPADDNDDDVSEFDDDEWASDDNDAEVPGLDADERPADDDELSFDSFSLSSSADIFAPSISMSQQLLNQLTHRLHLNLSSHL